MEGNVGVDLKYAMHRPDTDRCPDGREDAYRDERVADFPPDLAVGRNAVEVESSLLEW